MCPKKLLMTLTKEGGGSFSIVSIFTLSTPIPCWDILCPKTIPSQTIKNATSPKLEPSSFPHTFSKPLLGFIGND